jgi:LacI family transcriptional regulator
LLHVEFHLELGAYYAEMFSRLHIVTLDRPVPNLRIDAVVVNNRAGAKAAVKHLIGHGHRRIAFVGLRAALFTMKTRYSGYRDAMQQAGLSPEDYIDCVSEEHTVDIVRAILSRRHPPTAFFTGNNLTTRFLLHAFNVLRIAVPQQIALSGFDDFDVADVLRPALTVVLQPVYKIGEVAADLLFQRIASGVVPKKGRRLTLPLEMVVRRSCGCDHDVTASRKRSDSAPHTRAHTIEHLARSFPNCVRLSPGEVSRVALATPFERLLW